MNFMALQLFVGISRRRKSGTNHRLAQACVHSVSTRIYQEARWPALIRSRSHSHIKQGHLSLKPWHLLSFVSVFGVLREVMRLYYINYRLRPFSVTVC